MRSDYDTRRFFRYLGYRPAALPYSCPNQVSVVVYCRADGDVLGALLEDTPFVLRDERFAVSVTDFRNNTSYPYFDACVVLATEFRGVAGGTVLYEFEDQHFTVAAGREKWGYPKQHSRIEVADDGRTIEFSAASEGALDLRVSADRGTPCARDAWSDLVLYPHLQVRAVPEFAGHGFESFQVLARDTSPDFLLTKRESCGARVEFGAALTVLSESTILGADVVLGDFHATEENTRPRLLADLAR